MNNRCFRLIFSKPLGFLIPVAEIANAQRKPGQQKVCSAASVPLIPPILSLKRLVLSVLLAATPGWAAAEILLDRNFGGTSVGSAANGVPVIEIAKGRTVKMSCSLPYNLSRKSGKPGASRNCLTV